MSLSFSTPSPTRMHLQGTPGRSPQETASIKTPIPLASTSLAAQTSRTSAGPISRRARTAAPFAGEGENITVETPFRTVIVLRAGNPNEPTSESRTALLTQIVSVNVCADTLRLARRRALFPIRRRNLLAGEFPGGGGGCGGGIRCWIEKRLPTPARNAPTGACQGNASIQLLQNTTVSGLAW